MADTLILDGVPCDICGEYIRGEVPDHPDTCIQCHETRLHLPFDITDDE